QRYTNFERALARLREALQHGPDNLNDLEKEGTIQRFEYTYELGWKTLKDFLQHSGVVLDAITPKSVIKAAYAAKLISDGQTWIDMLQHRNLVAHDYDEDEVSEVLHAIHRRYLGALDSLNQRLKNES